MSDIARLFASDPLGHTEKDIDAMIAHFRSARGLFKETGKAPAKLSKAEQAVKKQNLKLDIDLDDLFGGKK